MTCTSEPKINILLTPHYRGKGLRTNDEEQLQLVGDLARR